MILTSFFDIVTRNRLLYLSSPPHAYQQHHQAPPESPMDVTVAADCACGLSVRLHHRLLSHAL